MSDTRQEPTLRVLRGEELVHVVRLVAAPVRIGRAPGNDVLVSDPAVSAQHATVWVDPSGAWIADHNSRNGTFVNEQRIRGAVRVCPSDVIRLGPFHLRVEGVTASGAGGWEVEDLDAGIRVPIRGSRFLIAASPAADLLLPDGDASEALVFARPDGDLWLAHGEHEGPLEPGDSFVVGGRRLRVTASRGVVPATQVEEGQAQFHLRATLNGPTGPTATISNPETDTSYTVDTDNRAVLLYLLARQLLADRRAGTPEAEAGWCGDDVVSHGIWGKQSDVDTNNLHVLVYRLRKELERAGFDPWFIEKRRRAIRARLQDVRID